MLKTIRYGGDLIYSAWDEEGVLEVVDAFGVRSLHFGTPPRQSAMNLRQPERLELAYVRAMLSGLLFAPTPARVLLVGLGGGSLAKFLLREFPLCQIEAVERRAGVAKVARQFFGLPQDERLKVHFADGETFLLDRSHHEESLFDHILVDAYDHIGMDQSINGEAFFQACLGLLRKDGVLSINLWGTHGDSLKRSLALLRGFFPNRAFRLGVPNRGNIIGVGLGEEVDVASPRKLAPRAQSLENQLSLEFSQFLRNLKRL